MVAKTAGLLLNTAVRSTRVYKASIQIATCTNAQYSIVILLANTYHG